jgi:hypothetical protein
LGTAKIRVWVGILKLWNPKNPEILIPECRDSRFPGFRVFNDIRDKQISPYIAE